MSLRRLYRCLYVGIFATDMIPAQRTRVGLLKPHQQTSVVELMPAMDVHDIVLVDRDILKADDASVRWWDGTKGFSEYRGIRRSQLRLGRHHSGGEYHLGVWKGLWV